MRKTILERLQTPIRGADDGGDGGQATAAPPAQPAPAAPAPTPPAAAAPIIPSTGQEAAAGADPGATPQGAGDAPEWAAGIREDINRLAEHLPKPAAPRNAFLEETGLVPPQQRQQQDPRLQAQRQTPAAPQTPAPGQAQPVPGQQPPVDDDAALIQQYITTEAQQAARQMVEPVLQQLHQDRRRENAEALLDDYPELRDNETANRVVTEARRWATEMGDPQKAADPAFIEMTLLASRALASATPENPGGTGAGQVQLERGGANGSATPGQQGAQKSLAREIVEADGPADPARAFWDM